MKNIHISVVIHFIGLCLCIESIFMLLGVSISFIYHDGAAISLLESFAITFLFGIILYFGTNSNKNEKPHIKESFLIVTFSWIFISLFGTLPYLLSHSISNFADALFETVSGFTTTGSSILNDIESLPKSILFWRSETHWIGGMGIIALVVAVLPSLEISGNHLFSAEGAFFQIEKIHPRLVDVVKRLWIIYILLTLSEILILIAAKMDWFDAVCHSFGTIATGGFSTKNSSLAEYSPAIQYIVATFMFLAGTNFILLYLALKGNFRKVIQNEEWKTYLFIILGITLIATYYNYPLYKTIESSFRHTLFQVISILSATGFSTADYEQWVYVAKYLLFFTMFIGACVGSTGGGIKIARYLILLKSIRVQLKKAIHPNAIIPMHYNGKLFDEKMLASITSFIIIYFLTFIIGSFFMMIIGLDPQSAFSSTITTLGGIGPGFGSVGPLDNFSSIPVLGKYYLSFNMILGRLEIISVLSLFRRSFYKI